MRSSMFPLESFLLWATLIRFASFLNMDTMKFILMIRSRKERTILTQLCSRNLDYLLHPSIEDNLTGTSRIADVGVGTGSYLVALSEQLAPTCRLDGFDISSAQFRQPQELPQNVHLHVHDAKQPFPTQFFAAFDAVHLRLLVSAMDKDDWAIVTCNVIQLLKPGGAIQWEEGDFINRRRLRGGGRGSSGDFLRFALQVNVTALSDRYKYGFSTLPQTFGDAGLNNIYTDIVATDRVPETRESMGRLSAVAVFGWARKERDAGRGDFWPGFKLEDVERKAYEDLDSGAYSRFDIYCTIAFKPES